MSQYGDEEHDRYHSHPWSDSPMIREALNERPPGEISVVRCDNCGSITYYNDGSHCTCEHCDTVLNHLIPDAITLEDHFDSLAMEGDYP